MRGRKSKLELTPRIRRLLVEKIRAGTPIMHACALAGIDKSTFSRWIQKGEGPKAAKRYRDFRIAITRARGEKVERLLTHIEQCGHAANPITGQKDWKAAAWILEHTEREEFHRRSDVAAEVIVEQRDPKAEIARLIDRLAAREGESAAAPKPDA